MILPVEVYSMSFFLFFGSLIKFILSYFITKTEQKNNDRVCSIVGIYEKEYYFKIVRVKKIYCNIDKFDPVF